jgi:hypothetical protein
MQFLSGVVVLCFASFLNDNDTIPIWGACAAIALFISDNNAIPIWHVCTMILPDFK